MSRIPVKTTLDIRPRPAGVLSVRDWDDWEFDGDWAMESWIDFTAPITRIIAIRLDDGTVMTGHPRGVYLDPPDYTDMEPSHPGRHIVGVTFEQEGEERSLGLENNFCRSAVLTEAGLEFK